MFQSLTDKLANAFKKFRNKGKLTEADVKAGMREIKLALLEADVNFKVVKEFVASVKEKCLGETVMASLTPGQQVIKIVNEELVKLMGTSAWYAPGAAAAQMVEAVICDSRRVVPVCAMLNGEYGYENIYLGVPVVLGANGIEKIIEVKLTDEEKALLDASAQAVKSVMKVLDDMQ